MTTRAKRAEQQIANQKQSTLDAYHRYRHNAPSAIREINDFANTRFAYIGFPHPTHEAFTYVDTKKLTIPFTAPSPFSLHQKGVAHSSQFPHTDLLYLLNGIPNNQLTHLGRVSDYLSVVPLSTALADDPTLSHRIKEDICTEEDPYALLSYAFLHDGTHLSLSHGTRMTRPLQITLCTTDESSLFVPAHLRIDIGAESDVTLILSTINNAATKNDLFSSSVIDITVGRGAKVTLIEDATDGDIVMMNKLTVRQQEESHVDFARFTTGGKLLRSHYDWQLKGEGASVDFRSLASLTSDNQSHTYARFQHQAAQCKSKILFRNVAHDRSFVSVDATVEVWPKTVGSSSHQLINNLLLSDDARASSKPNLTIKNDDVDCSHGTTVGALDANQLLYLRSRGFDEAAARKLLLHAFMASIIDVIDDEAIRASLTQRLQQGGRS